ncbi:hypothetical protein HDV02_002481 [Globomyces sp. JEL0801]|nr:hypothetical protein HDV02_002481 [Globomyces sp. JEL0801]
MNEGSSSLMDILKGKGDTSKVVKKDNDNNQTVSALADIMPDLNRDFHIAELSRKVTSMEMTISNLSCEIRDLKSMVSNILNIVADPESHYGRSVPNIRLRNSASSSASESLDPISTSSINQYHHLDIPETPSPTFRTPLPVAGSDPIIVRLESHHSDLSGLHTLLESELCVNLPNTNTTTTTTTTTARTRLKPRPKSMLGLSFTSEPQEITEEMSLKDQSYKYKDRPSIYTAFILSMIDTVKRRIEASKKCMFNNSSSSTFQAVKIAVSNISTYMNVEYVGTKDLGIIAAMDLMRSTSRTPNIAIHMNAFVVFSRSKANAPFIRTLMALIKHLAKVYEIFEPPGDQLIHDYGGTLINEATGEFALPYSIDSMELRTPVPLQETLLTMKAGPFGNYVASRLAGFDINESMIVANESQSFTAGADKLTSITRVREYVLNAAFISISSAILPLILYIAI